MLNLCTLILQARSFRPPHIEFLIQINYLVFKMENCSYFQLVFSDDWLNLVKKAEHGLIDLKYRFLCFAAFCQHSGD